MDQPFESNVIEDLAVENPLSSAEEFDEFEGMEGEGLDAGLFDEMLDLAEAGEDLDAAIPIIAGLTIRTTMPQASRFPDSTRRQLVCSVSQSIRTLARRQGTEAVRAVPCVVGAVQRTAQRRRMPIQHPATTRGGAPHYCQSCPGAKFGAPQPREKSYSRSASALLKSHQ